MQFLSLCCGTIVHDVDKKVCPKCEKECEIVDDRIYDRHHDFGLSLPSLDELPGENEL